MEGSSAWPLPRIKREDLPVTDITHTVLPLLTSITNRPITCPPLPLQPRPLHLWEPPECHNSGSPGAGLFPASWEYHWPRNLGFFRSESTQFGSAPQPLTANVSDVKAALVHKQMVSRPYSAMTKSLESIVSSLAPYRETSSPRNASMLSMLCPIDDMLKLTTEAERGRQQFLENPYKWSPVVKPLSTVVKLGIDLERFSQGLIRSAVDHDCGIISIQKALRRSLDTCLKTFASDVAIAWDMQSGKPTALDGFTALLGYLHCKANEGIGLLHSTDGWIAVSEWKSGLKDQILVQRAKGNDLPGWHRLRVAFESLSEPSHYCHLTRRGDLEGRTAIDVLKSSGIFTGYLRHNPLWKSQQKSQALLRRQQALWSDVASTHAARQTGLEDPVLTEHDRAKLRKPFQDFDRALRGMMRASTVQSCAIPLDQESKRQIADNAGYAEYILDDIASRRDLTHDGQKSASTTLSSRYAQAKRSHYAVKQLQDSEDMATDISDDMIDKWFEDETTERTRKRLGTEPCSTVADNILAIEGERAKQAKRKQYDEKYGCQSIGMATEQRAGPAGGQGRTW